MTTVRLQIVDAIATALATATGLTVHRDLDFALESENLPALVIMPGPDRPDEDATQIQVLDQSALLELTVLIARSATPEADADAHEATIHASLMAAATFGGQPVIMNRVSGEWSFDLGDCAARTLTYRFGYRTSFADLSA